MAQIKNSKKSEGICEKIHNAVSPFRPRIRRISHQPQSSISVTSNKKPVEILSSPQTKPVHVHHRTSMSESIPVEFGHSKIKQSHDERDIVIVRSQKFSKSASKKQEYFSKKGNHEDHHDDHTVHEGRFSDYISKFKHRMIKTASNAGGGDGGGGGSGSGGGGRGNFIRRDSFNDKATSYIDRAKMKIRTTTNVGGEGTNPPSN